MDWVILAFAGMLGGNLAGGVFRTLNQGLRVNTLAGLVSSGLGAVVLAGLGLPVFAQDDGTAAPLRAWVSGGVFGAVG